MSIASLALLVVLRLAAGSARAEENAAAIKGTEEYLAFADYRGATIVSEQIPADDWQNFFIVDARNA
jgi:hypothetical protein